MKSFRVKQEGKGITLEYDDKTSRYEAMMFVIRLFGCHLIDKGRGEELQRLLNALEIRNDGHKEKTKSGD